MIEAKKRSSFKIDEKKIVGKFTKEGRMGLIMDNDSEETSA
jgi:hypothetical protein